jgi:hypothetical protein
VGGIFFLGILAVDAVVYYLSENVYMWGAPITLRWWEIYLKVAHLMIKKRCKNMVQHADVVPHRIFFFFFSLVGRSCERYRK